MSLGDELDATKKAVAALEPLDPEARKRALRWLAEGLGVDLGSTSGVDQSGGGGGRNDEVGRAGSSSGETETRTKLTAKRFLLDKSPVNKGEQLAVLGYYKTHYQDTETFSTPDLIALNVDAGGERISNANRDMDNATRTAGLFVNAGDRKKKLSALGELVVEAMPDRDRVKEVLKGRRTRRRTTKKAAKKATKSAKRSGS